MREPIRISAKNLGTVALPEFCPWCFWIKLRLRDKLPFQIFPGIFTAIDLYNNTIWRRRPPAARGARTAAC